MGDWTLEIYDDNGDTIFTQSFFNKKIEDITTHGKKLKDFFMGSDFNITKWRA